MSDQPPHLESNDDTDYGWFVDETGSVRLVAGGTLVAGDEPPDCPPVDTPPSSS